MTSLSLTGIIKDEVGPLIWLDDARRNMDQTTFGLYTAIKDIRQGKNANNGEFHESLNSLAAILGAGLVGIDKTNQDGYNYVKWCRIISILITAGI